VALHGARSDAHELGRVSNGSASFDEGGEDLHLALHRLRREGAAQVLAGASRLLLARAIPDVDTKRPARTNRAGLVPWSEEVG